MNPLSQDLFARLSLHAKIHQQLDQHEQRYRAMLQRIERAEVLAAHDDITYDELVRLKKELMAIRFAEKEKPTSPSP